MNTQFSQLIGIIKYEFKMHWRKRALLVILLTLIAVNLPVALMVGSMDLAEDVNSFYQDLMDNTSDAQQQTVTTAMIQFFSWGALGIILCLVLPVAMADTIPLDRQLGVAELIDSTPLLTSTYLVGKVIGMWIAVLSITLPLTFLGVLMWRLALGPFALKGYLEMWLGAVTALIVINGSIGVLLPAAQPTRRRAIMVVAGVLFVTVLVVPNVDPDTPMTVKDYLHPLRPPMFVHYMTGLLEDTGGDIFLSISVGLAQLLLLWAAMWAWIRYRMKTA